MKRIGLCSALVLLLLASPALADIVNVWVALRDDAQQAIITRLQCDRDEACIYSGPVTNRQARVFEKMSDRASVQRLFRVDTDAGRDWTVWSLYFDEPVNVLLLVQAELDNLATSYPTQFRIAGAWRWQPGDIASRQVGTQLVIDTRTVTKTWSILNPDYQPDPGEPDHDPRFVIRVTGDVDEDYVSGITGTPTYPVPARLIEAMPDIDDVGTRPTVLSDVNLLMGQPTRWFN